MNRREKVLATMNRELIDRVVTVYKGTQEVDEKLMEHFSVSTIDDLLAKLGVDYNHWPFVSIQADEFSAFREDGDILWDIWGITEHPNKYKTKLENR